jgi:hypothetical protein
LDVDRVLKREKIRNFFKPIVLSAKNFENLLPADAPAQNPFERFAEDRALNEFLCFGKESNVSPYSSTLGYSFH